MTRPLDLPTPRDRVAPRTPARLIRELLVVVLVSLLAGGLTSFAQLLSGPLEPIANSASGWTLLTAIVVWAVCRTGAVVAAVLGACSFVALLVGYQVVSALRGHPIPRCSSP